MKAGDALHNENPPDYWSAVQYAARAVTLAEPYSLDQARAARGIAARLDRLEQDPVWSNQMETVHETLLEQFSGSPYADAPVTPSGWLETALEIHNVLIREDRYDFEAHRERAQDYMYLGAFAVGSFVREELRSGAQPGRVERANALESLKVSLMEIRDTVKNRQAWGELEGEPIDIYEIATVGRLALAHAAYGSRRTGLRYARLAWDLAPLCQSPKLDTSDKSFTPELRANAANKARKRALAGFAANIAEPRRTRLKIVNKAL